MQSNAGADALLTPPHYEAHAIRKRPSRPALHTGLSTGFAFHVQMTPPETPVSPQDAADSQPAQSLFHNYLRAFYPFDAATSKDTSDESLLMTASIKPGDLILVHSVHANGWADGTVLTTGTRGWLPTNYCEAYDHPYLRNLLNAMTQFWDLLGANEDANLSAFVRQDYIRGLIAGVRYLLEHADCLHRDAALVQRHTGIRRMRKGLLADLSSLVQIAKGLQDTISEPFAAEVLHVLLEDLMTKAFKVVTRAVGFVDMWTKEATETATAESSRLPPHDPTTPPLEIESLAIDTEASLKAGLKHPVDSAKSFTAITSEMPEPQVHEADLCAGAERGAIEEMDEARPLSSGFQSRVAHRLSLVQPKQEQQSALASQQLATTYDSCISLIGAFVGHHLHCRPSSELVDTTQRLVAACRSLLAIVDEVYSHDSQQSVSVQQARINLQMKLDELVKSTRDVFKFSDLEDGELIMMPDQSKHLVTVGTSLIRNAGECVTKTRSLIEQIGDFALNRIGITGDESKPTPEQQTASLPAARLSLDESPRKPLTSFEKRLSRKLLPPPPPMRPSSLTATDTVDFAFNTSGGDYDTVTTSSAGSQKPFVPSMQRRSAIRKSQAAISGASLRGSRSPGRKGSVGVSIADSTGTQRSSERDSGISAVSEVSTRATTPDQMQDPNSPNPALLNSFTSMSSIQSVTTEIESEAESQLLQRTFASELTLNKDGQVSGGSLPALVEQLTTHDSAPDPQFVTAFYITFRRFTTPRELAQALISRFEYVGESRTVGTPVRLRIYNVFKGWLETYWNAEADKDALGDIRFFAVHKLKPHLPSAGDRLLDLTKKVTALYHTGMVTGPLVSGVGKTSMSIAAQSEVGKIAPEPAITKSQLNNLRAAVSGDGACSLLDFEPVELARQFTLMTSKIFCDIQAEELLSLDWGKQGTQSSPNVRNMCAINTDLAHLVGETVLAPEDAKKRAIVIKHWSKIAAACLELNNYDSVMAILCSLNSSVVQRLRRTWELVSKKSKTRLSQLNAVIDLSRNYASLRRRLETPVAPCIPFLGIYLTDLTFLEAGNPKTRQIPGLASDNGKTVSVINFDKHMRMAKVVSHLQKFQIPYRLQAVPEMQAWMESHLHRMRAENEEMVSKFHRRSLLVEPKQDELKPTKTAEGSAEDRPKTSAGNMERLEGFLRANTFTFKSAPDLPSMAKQQ